MRMTIGSALRGIFSKPLQQNYNLARSPSTLMDRLLPPDNSALRWQENKPLLTFLSVVTPTKVSSLSSLKLDPCFHHTVTCYASILNALTSHGVRCRVPTMIVLMTATCRSGQDCLYLVDLCKKIKSRLTPQCYEALLDVLARFDLVHECKRVYVDMLGEGIVSRGIYTSNIMINAYCKVGYVVEARQYLCKMIQAGLSPDHSTFTSLILGHSRKQNDVDAAFRVFTEMVDHGVCAQGYDNLVVELCGVGNPRIAKRVLDQMLKEGVAPSGMVFHAFVTCCCKLQEYGEAVEVLDDLIRSGHPPRFEDCKMLVSKLRDGGEKDKVESIIQKLIRCGIYDEEIAREKLT